MSKKLNGSLVHQCETNLKDKLAIGDIMPKTIWRIRMQHVLEKAQAVKAASSTLACVGSLKKNEALNAMAQALRDSAAYILAENEKDLQAGRDKGTSKAMLV